MRTEKGFTVKISKDTFGDPNHYVLSFYYDTDNFEKMQVLNCKEDLKCLANTINTFLESGYTSIKVDQTL